MWDGARMVLMVRSRGELFLCLNVGSSGIRRKGGRRGGIRAGRREGDAVGWRKVLQFPQKASASEERDLCPLNGGVLYVSAQVVMEVR